MGCLVACSDNRLTTFTVSWRTSRAMWPDSPFAFLMFSRAAQLRHMPVAPFSLRKCARWFVQPGTTHFGPCDGFPPKISTVQFRLHFITNPIILHLFRARSAIYNVCHAGGCRCDNRRVLPHILNIARQRFVGSGFSGLLNNLRKLHGSLFHHNKVFKLNFKLLGLRVQKHLFNVNFHARNIPFWKTKD